MRSHDRAVELMGQRARAALGIDAHGTQMVSIEPEAAIRRLLSGLVPLEELDHVLNGIAASTQNVFDALDHLGAMDEAGDLDSLDEARAGTLLFAFAQEIVYGLLLAGNDVLPKELRDR